MIKINFIIIVYIVLVMLSYYITQDIHLYRKKIVKYVTKKSVTNVFFIQFMRSVFKVLGIVL